MAPGISSHFNSTISLHGEGDPTTTSVGVGTTQGACQTTQLVGGSSSMAPPLGRPMSSDGPSNSYIAVIAIFGCQVIN